MNNTTKIAAAYIRVSTDDQIEFSPDSQIKALLNYAKTHNMCLPQEYIYVDEGISGKSVKKRVAFSQMIAAAKSVPKKFDVILVWKFSRFARNREDSVVYKSMLRKQYGIDVVSVSENVGDDKMSILFEAMIEAMDEYYSINLAEEVKRGMTEKAKRGGVLSVASFGYNVKNGEYVINPEQADIIKKVFNDYASGKGMLTIAKELNSLNIKTNRGNQIENRTIEYWLNNPVYIGKTRWCTEGRMRRNFNAENVIISDGGHQPIIDINTWNIVQKRLQDTKEHFRKFMRKDNDCDISHWLTGTLRCSKCGAVLANYGKFFGCSNKGRGTCEGCGTIQTNIVEQIVLDQLEKVFNYEVSNITVEDSDNKQQDTDTTQKAILNNRLKSALDKLERVKAAYENGIDTLEEYIDNKKRLTLEIESLNKEISKKNKVPEDSNSGSYLKPNLKSPNDDRKRVIGILCDSTISNSDKRKVLTKIVKNIYKLSKGSRDLKIVFWNRA